MTVPSLSVAVALMVKLVPTVELFAGLVIATAGGAGWTVSSVLPLIPLRVAEIVVVPAVKPVARPAMLMVARVVFDEFQVAWLVRFCVLLSRVCPGGGELLGIPGRDGRIGRGHRHGDQRRCGALGINAIPVGAAVSRGNRIRPSGDIVGLYQRSVPLAPAV